MEMMKTANRLLVILMLIGIAHAADLESEVVVVKDGFQWPKEGEVASMLVALKITNSSDAAVVINRYDSPVPVFEDASGKPLKVNTGRDVFVAPAKSNYFVLRARHTIYLNVDVSVVRQGDHYRFYGIGTNGNFWECSGRESDFSRIGLVYRSEDHQVVPVSAGVWVGEKVTKMVSFR
ncbi:MAG: hypothetical protein QM680_10930 [Luteolibacter sp.]